MTSISKVALQIAQSQLGIKEIPLGSNAGPDVEKYLKRVGLGKGYPWCMAFAYWCVDEAAKKLVVPNPLLKTGGVIAQLNAQKAKVVKVPQAGDLFIIEFSGGNGHIGFVLEVKGDRILTIEGNSNDDGSREGYEVCHKPNGRLISSIHAFIRF